jgi:hypothetical protein
MSAGPHARSRWTIVLALAIGLGVLALANAHLVYVSVASQPDCVPHLKPGHAGQGYRAARSSC